MLQFLQNISFYTPEVQTFGNSRTFVMETPRTLIIAQESVGVSKSIAQHSMFWSFQRKMFGGSKTIAQQSVFLEFPTKDVTSYVWSFQNDCATRLCSGVSTQSSYIRCFDFPNVIQNFIYCY